MNPEVNVAMIVAVIMAGYVVTQVITAFVLYFLLSKMLKADLQKLVTDKSHDYFKATLRSDIERSVSEVIAAQMGQLISSITMIHTTLVDVTKSLASVADKMDRLHDICPLGRSGNGCQS